MDTAAADVAAAIARELATKQPGRRARLRDLGARAAWHGDLASVRAVLDACALRRTDWCDAVAAAIERARPHVLAALFAAGVGLAALWGWPRHAHAGDWKRQMQSLAMAALARCLGRCFRDATPTAEVASTWRLVWDRPELVPRHVSGLLRYTRHNACHLVWACARDTPRFPWGLVLYEWIVLGWWIRSVPGNAASALGWWSLVARALDRTSWSPASGLPRAPAVREHAFRLLVMGALPDAAAWRATTPRLGAGWEAALLHRAQDMREHLPEVLWRLAHGIRPGYTSPPLDDAEAAVRWVFPNAYDLGWWLTLAPADADARVWAHVAKAHAWILRELAWRKRGPLVALRGALRRQRCLNDGDD